MPVVVYQTPFSFVSKKLTRQVYTDSTPRSVESAHPNKRPERAAQDQKCENTGSGLVGLRDGIRLRHVVRLLARVGVSLGNTAGSVRHGWFGVANQQARYSRQHVHLLSSTARLVDSRVDKDSIAPVESAGAARLSTRALLDGGFGRGLEDGEDLFFELRDDLSDDGEPSVDVALEGKHVGRAGTLTAFAGDLPCDALGEEVLEEGIGEVVDAGLPDFGTIRLSNVSIHSRERQVYREHT